MPIESNGNNNQKVTWTPGQESSIRSPVLHGSAGKGSTTAMITLNPDLFERLRQKFNSVAISNNRQPIIGMYLPNVYRRGRLSLNVVFWGETYKVNCPFCCDQRRRLNICHRWGRRDVRTRDDLLHLAYCFNEQCLSSRERQKQLHAILFPEGHYAKQVEIPAMPVGGLPPPPAPIYLPQTFIPLDQLCQDHPARYYLQQRGFDPDQLARDYEVGYCDISLFSNPPIKNRIVVPIYRPALLSPAMADSGQRVIKLAGWQARAIQEPPGGVYCKYLTATGTRKSCLLYGLPTAITTSGPAVIVEGITDAWRIGPTAVALLGKSISPQQVRLAVRYFRGRPVIIWLDDDAEKDAARVREQLERGRAEIDDKSGVFVAVTPTGRKDPGECNSSEISDAIELAMMGRSNRVYGSQKRS